MQHSFEFHAWRKWVMEVITDITLCRANLCFRNFENGFVVTGAMFYVGAVGGISQTETIRGLSSNSGSPCR